MKAGNTINRVVDAVNTLIDALTQAGAVADEIDQIGGVSALQTYAEANADAIGFTYTDLSNAVATIGNARNLSRNQSATFPAGSATNLAKVRT